jgi:putative FmdB family regulatory protein
MPIFEFECKECAESFEELVRSPNATDEVVCPECGSPQVRKKISTFASRLSGSSISLGSAVSSSACSTGST